MLSEAPAGEAGREWERDRLNYYRVCIASRAGIDMSFERTREEAFLVYDLRVNEAYFCADFRGGYYASIEVGYVRGGFLKWDMWL